MMNVSIIGTGNVAKHLFDALLKCENIAVHQVIGRSKEQLFYFEKETTVTYKWNKIQEVDVYIIAVSDDSISLVSEHLKDNNGLVVHTSGSVSLDTLSLKNRRGVFYPLQTFREGQKVNFKTVPICIETEKEADLKILSQLANALSDVVHEITSDQRKYLHLAAVFINNFTNHIYQIGDEICTAQELPFSILQPLLMETAEKMKAFSPYEAQTGPAKRNDIGTIEKHMDLLKTDAHKRIYALLSQSIQQTYGKKL